MFRNIRRKNNTLRVEKGDYIGDADTAYDEIQTFFDEHDVDVRGPQGWHNAADELWIDNTWYMDMDNHGPNITIKDVLTVIHAHEAKEKSIQQFCAEHKVELCQSQQPYALSLYIDGYNYGFLNLPEFSINTVVGFTKQSPLEDKKEDKSTSIIEDKRVVIENWRQLYQTLQEAMAFLAQLKARQEDQVLAIIRANTEKADLIQKFCNEHKVELHRSGYEQPYYLYIDNHNYGLLDPQKLTIDTIVDFTKQHLQEKKKAKEDKSTARERVFIDNWEELDKTVRGASKSDEKKGSGISLHKHPSTQFSSVRHRSLPASQENRSDDEEDNDNDNPCPQFLRKACTFL